MSGGAVAARLGDGRLHLQHGPIDLVVEACGSPGAVECACRAAARRFETVLGELVEELARLRSPCPPQGLGLRGAVARRMERAVLPHARAGRFVTPMAAVAGAVAEEILAAMRAAAVLRRAYVNNGGDIALHLDPGEHFDVACAVPVRGGGVYAMACIGAEDGTGGLASSGRGGRSFSLGLADSVTVLAASAPAADVAATLLGNAVDLPGHPAIHRRPACELDPDSDLGRREVVTGVDHLAPEEVARALERGVAEARRMQARGEIRAAAWLLQGQVRISGGLLRPARQDVRAAA